MNPSKIIPPFCTSLFLGPPPGTAIVPNCQIMFSGVSLRNALLKQCYINLDLDDIFTIPEMPKLEMIFVQQKRRFYKRTSSAQWGKMPISNNLPSK